MRNIDKNLQRNNVARQVEGFCISYFAAFTTIWTVQVSLWHAFYLFSGQGIPRMLQGEILAFCCTFVSLKGHIFASIEKFGSQVWKVANESLVAYTDLFVSLVMIPDLIRLANDIETNPGPAVVDSIDSSKTICAPYSSSNILSSLSNRQFF